MQEDKKVSAVREENVDSDKITEYNRITSYDTGTKEPAERSSEQFCDRIQMTVQEAAARGIPLIKIFTVSTKDTPDTAASPQTDIITVSTMPTSMIKSCSTKSGNINFLKSLLV